MKKVDLLYFGWKNAPNGVSSFVKKFQESINYFKEENIELNIYSLDNIEPKDFNNTSAISSSGKTSGLKQFILENAKNSTLLGIFSAWRRYFYNGKRVAKFYFSQKRQADIVFVNDLFVCYYYLKLRKSNDCKVIFVLHSDGSFYKMLFSYYPKIEKSIFNRFLRKAKSKILSEVNQIGFVSDFSRRNFLSLNKQFNEQKTFYIHNGIEDINFKAHNFNDGKIKMTCAGAVSHRKGHDIIINTLIDLDADIRGKFEFNFLGDGPLLNDLKKTCNTNGIDNVYFLGNKSNVADYLDKTDWFILISRDEGLPISIIEALRSGLPILSTKVAGIPEQVINGKNGYLIAPDISELASVLTRIAMLDKKVFAEFGKKSREIYESNFQIDKMLESYKQLFLAS